MKLKETNRLWKSTTGGALQDRCLIIYEGKTGLKAELWNSGKIHWKSAPNKPISTAWFYYKDGDATEYRIREYFNF